MRLARRPCRCTAWIAIFAILLAALAPTLARALSPAQSQPAPWAEICTLGGTQPAHDLAPDSGSGSGRHGGMGFKHCPCCLSHAGHFVLPAAPLARLPAAEVRAAVFPPALTTPPPRFTRAAAAPRAPPVHS